MPSGRAADLAPFLAGRGLVSDDGGNRQRLAVIVYREDETWDTEVLPTALTEDLSGLVHALRQQPSIGGTIGLVTVGDDFFVALRVVGGQVSVFLSDLTAAVDWPLARQVLDYLDIPIPGDEDLDQVLPAGDMSIFADLGIDEMDLGALAGDLDSFPTRPSPRSRPGSGSGTRWTGPSTSCSGREAPAAGGVTPVIRWSSSPRCGPRSRKRSTRGARAPTCPSERSCSTRPERSSAVPTTGARRTRDPTAHAEIVAIRQAARDDRRLAPGGLHPRGHAGAVHHVRGRDRSPPGWRDWCMARPTRGQAPPVRSGTCCVTAGSATGSR